MTKHMANGLRGMKLSRLFESLFSPSLDNQENLENFGMMVLFSSIMLSD